MSYDAFKALIKSDIVPPGQRKEHLMAILDPAWSTVTAEIELSTRLCCGLTDLCFVSAWDLETLEIYNVQNNTLSLAPGEVH